MNNNEGNLLEKGCFGYVSKAIRNNNQPVAIKTPFNTDEAINFFKNEVAIHRNLSHPNIVNFLDAVDSKPTYNLVMELMQGDLFNFISDQNGRISSRTRFAIALEIIRGLSYLHNEARILHRDLKIENILYKKQDETIIIKICDFGLSAPVDNQLTDFVGTPEYVAPELILKRPSPYTIKSDIRAFAIIAWMLTTLKDPFSKAHKNPNRKNPDDILQLIVNGQCDDIVKNTHVYLSKIILDCRAYNRNNRPVTRDIETLLSEALTFPHEIYHHELLQLSTRPDYLIPQRKAELLSIIKQYPDILTWALDDNGDTVLHYAFATNNIAVIDELSKLPQWGTLSQTKNIKKETLWHSLAVTGHTNLHSYLHAVNINAKSNNGTTALMYASQWQRANVCQFLLEHGANTEIKNNDNNSAEYFWQGIPQTNPFILFRNKNCEVANNPHTLFNSVNALAKTNQSESPDADLQVSGCGLN